MSEWALMHTHNKRWYYVGRSIDVRSKSVRSLPTLDRLHRFWLLVKDKVCLLKWKFFFYFNDRLIKDLFISIQCHLIDRMSPSQCQNYLIRSKVGESNGIRSNVERSSDVVPFFMKRNELDKSKWPDYSSTYVNLPPFNFSTLVLSHLWLISHTNKHCLLTFDDSG